MSSSTHCSSIGTAPVSAIPTLSFLLLYFSSFVKIIKCQGRAFPYPLRFRYTLFHLSRCVRGNIIKEFCNNTVSLSLRTSPGRSLRAQIASVILKTMLVWPRGVPPSRPGPSASVGFMATWWATRDDTARRSDSGVRRREVVGSSTWARRRRSTPRAGTAAAGRRRSPPRTTPPPTPPSGSTACSCGARVACLCVHNTLF